MKKLWKLIWDFYLGNDNIQAAMLKNLHSNALSYLLSLFNSILSQKIYSPSWKTTITRPTLIETKFRPPPLSPPIAQSHSWAYRVNCSKKSSTNDYYGSWNSMFCPPTNMVSARAVTPSNHCLTFSSKSTKPSTLNLVSTLSSLIYKNHFLESGATIYVKNSMTLAYEETSPKFFKASFTTEQSQSESKTYYPPHIRSKMVYLPQRGSF